MRLILVSQVEADKIFFEKVAKAAHYSFQQFNSAVQAVEDLARDSSAVVFVDASTPALYSSFEHCVADKLGLYSAIVNPNQYFFISSMPFPATSHLHPSQIMGHFIQRNYHKDDHEVFARFVARMGGDDAFGLENFFGPDVKVQIIEPKKSAEKIVVLEALREYLARWGMNSRAGTLVVTAVDELLMNAIYDAPVDDLGKPLYASTPRNTPLDLTGKNAIEVRIAHDENLLGVSVVDQYGSFDRQKLISVLGKSYRNEEFKVRTNVAGAGLGLSEAYSHSGGAVFVCEPGIRSEFMLFYKRSTSFKEFRDQFRFLSTFMLQG